VAEILEPYVARVVVSNPLKTKAIAESTVKTDKVDSQTLAQLLRVRFPSGGLAPERTISITGGS